MEDINKFISSKANDEFVAAYLSQKYGFAPDQRDSDPNYRLEFIVTSAHSPADFSGIDIQVYNRWQGRISANYDTKYLFNDRLFDIWVPFDKFDIQSKQYVEIKTTHYLYVAQNIAFEFRRDEFLKLNSINKYKKFKSNDNYYIKTLAYMPLQDLFNMKSYRNHNEFLEKYLTQLVDFDKLGIIG